ncbi:hypothetical protein QTQ03_01400 [Micromonospora sp. WMMA1363]|nr:hypothetical protein [Micromonospora sp. WMMA1363]MDM4718306.1 hypothetical protein [Micromonospora sp. WMMA1363]
MCSFDPRGVQWGNTTLDMPALGFDWHERFAVHDELTGAGYDWGQRNAVRLDPYLQPAHVLTVRHSAPPAPVPPAAASADLTVAPALASSPPAPHPRVRTIPDGPADRRPYPRPARGTRGAPGRRAYHDPDAAAWRR